MTEPEQKTKSDIELAEWHNYWRNRLERNDKLVDAIALDGMKYSLLSHAAIIVLSFNSFTTSTSTNLRPILLFVMLCGFVGIVLSALGHIVLLESVTHFTSEARGHLIRHKSFRAASAIAVYGDRVMSRPIKWAARLIYGSLIWLGVYAFAAMNMLWHNSS